MPLTDSQKLFLVLLGVAGVGAIAYAASAKASPEPSPPLPPGPPRPPQGPSPNQPGANPDDVAAQALAAALAAASASQGQPNQPGNPAVSSMMSGTLLPNPAPLVQGQRYKARLELSGLEQLGGRDDIKKAFEGFGFSNVLIYMNQAELPPGFPPMALAGIDSGSRWAEGTWNQPSQTIPKPQQIQNAWIA